MTIEQLARQLRSERIPAERRKALRAYLDANPDYKITDVLLLEPQDQIEIMELIQGVVRKGGRPEAHPEQARAETFRLRTVTGEPLGKVKMGLDPDFSGTTRDERRLHRVGLSPYIYREFPAEFSVNAAVATMLLTQFGYMIARPRFTNRNAELRGEKDANGHPVKPRSRWLLVEVGSVLEQRAREARDLVDPEPAKPRKG